MKPSPKRREEVFVIRMWVESGADVDAWRARAVHIASHDQQPFTRYEDLCRFLERRWRDLSRD